MPMRLAPVPIPRGHGDVMPAKTYHASRQLRLEGALYTDPETGLTAQDMLDQMRAFFRGVMLTEQGRLEFQNNTYLNVWCKGPTIKKDPGFPDVRTVTIDLLAADPLSYNITPTTITLPNPGYVLAATIDGNIETTNWQFTLQIQDVSVSSLFLVDGTGQTLQLTNLMKAIRAGDMPADHVGDQIRILGQGKIQRKLASGGDFADEWSLYKDGAFFRFAPGLVQVGLTTPAGTPVNLGGSRVTLVDGSISAAWSGYDDAPTAAPPPGGIFDQATFDSSTFG